MMTDPIADMLTRIRNANSIYQKKVSIPHSKIKQNIAIKLKEQGFIEDFKIEEDTFPKNIVIYLKYGPEGEKIIQRIQRVSTPGRRVYQKVKNIRKVLGGLGVLILSTPKGILTD